MLTYFTYFTYFTDLLHLLVPFWKCSTNKTDYTPTKKLAKRHRVLSIGITGLLLLLLPACVVLCSAGSGCLALALACSCSCYRLVFSGACISTWSSSSCCSSFIPIVWLLFVNMSSYTADRLIVHGFLVYCLWLMVPLARRSVRSADFICSVFGTISFVIGIVLRPR